MATLLFSQGVPMIRAGDEICHSQNGNNNTYCQDNELSWINWQLGDREKNFFAMVCQAIQLRRRLPVLRRQRFFQGQEIHGTSNADIRWITQFGVEMQEIDWHEQFCGHAFQCLLSSRRLHASAVTSPSILERHLRYLHEPQSF